MTINHVHLLNLATPKYYLLASVINDIYLILLDKSVSFRMNAESYQQYNMVRLKKNHRDSRQTDLGVHEWIKLD